MTNHTIAFLEDRLRFSEQRLSECTSKDDREYISILVDYNKTELSKADTHDEVEIEEVQFSGMHPFSLFFALLMYFPVEALIWTIDKTLTWAYREDDDDD